MRKKKPSFDSLLASQSRRLFLETSHNWSIDLSLPQAQTLTNHLKTVEPVRQTVRFAIIHTYTSSLLDPWLNLHAASHGITLETYHAPYGMNLTEAQENSPLQQHRPTFTLFLLKREDLHPAFLSPTSSLGVSELNKITEEAINRITQILSQFRKTIPGRLLLSFLPRFFGPELGSYDTQAEKSTNIWWAKFKERLTENLAEEIDSCALIDFDEILSDVGRKHFFDLRFWYTSQFPFSSRAASEVSRHLVNLISLPSSSTAKVIALDADNTLWGGIVGEDGINGIAIGPEYPGNVFLDFQRRILDFQQRGFILVLVSKNNHDDVIEVLQSHPHQILREEHFAATRINWSAKTDNLRSIANELNLGLDSFIFIDDSDYECGNVRLNLPEVQVIQTPGKAVDIPFCLDNLNRLEILNQSQEDALKTRLYADEKKRKNLQKNMGSEGYNLENYLKSLSMTMTISIDSSHQIPRLAQLTQKTNQFNLTTRRYNEQHIKHRINSDEWLVASFSLSDSFGDSGTVGLALVEITSSESCNIDTFLMSCRVIGRLAESAFLEAFLKKLPQSISQVNAEYIASTKNALVKDFYSDHQFTSENNLLFTRSLIEHPAEEAEKYPIQILFS